MSSAQGLPAPELDPSLLAPAAAAPTDTAERERGHVLRVATGSWLVVAICALGLTPVYPEVAAGIGTSPGQFGALVGISFLLGSALQIPSGALADQYGYRRLLLFGLVMTGVTPALWAIAHNGAGFALGQAAQGLAVVTLQAGGITAVASAFSARGRSAAIGYIWSASSVGLIASQLLYGVAGAHFGWRSVALGVCWLPVLLLPMTWRMPDVRVEDSPRSLTERALESLRFLFHPTALSLAGITAVVMAVGFGTTFLTPFLLQARGYGSATTSLFLLAYVLGGIPSAPLMGHLADRVGFRVPLIIPLLVGAAALAALAGAGTNTAVFVVALVVIGGLVNGAAAVLQSIAADTAARLGGVGAGAALASVRLTQSLGTAIAPVAVGATYSRFGYGTAELGMAVLLVLAALLVWRGVPRKQSLVR